MHDQPVYELEALAHHEGIPGHHMQIAIAQELTGWNFCARRDWWWTRVCTRKNGHATKRSIT
ncbi:MAG: hypothetical protein DMF15_09085 [Verrucomicrobia bacterium]|nr:MAG: hypothetical protein DMF15_09085 [Verrucomicrobiota bacterium]